MDCRAAAGVVRNSENGGRRERVDEYQLYLGSASTRVGNGPSSDNSILLSDIGSSYVKISYNDVINRIAVVLNVGRHARNRGVGIKFVVRITTKSHVCRYGERGGQSVGNMVGESPRDCCTSAVDISVSEGLGTFARIGIQAYFRILYRSKKIAARIGDGWERETVSSGHRRATDGGTVRNRFYHERVGNVDEDILSDRGGIVTIICDGIGACEGKVAGTVYRS